MIRTVDRIFGTDVALVGPDPSWHARTFATLRAADAVFSRFRPDSELRAVNAGAGRPVAASPLFRAALQDACGHAVRTGGVFSPLLGRDVAATGYTADFDPRSRWPHREPDPEPAPPRVEIDHYRGTVRLDGGAAVDLDGFVKGWLGQRLAAQATDPGLIDLGGDVVAWGGTDDRPWRVTAGAGVIELGAAGAAATSSTLLRTWIGADGVRRHPTIDPRTGSPSRSDLVTVTVVTDDLATAEVEATRGLVLGSAHRPPAAVVRGWSSVDRHGAVHRGGSLR